MPEVINDTNDPNYIPYDSPESTPMDAYHESPYYYGSKGQRCYQNPPPTPKFDYSPPEPLIIELREIKDLLKEILRKL